MVVDTSALVAIALEEADADRMLSSLVDAESACISAANLFETYVVINGRRKPHAVVILDSLLELVSLIVEPVTEAQVAIARDAFQRYGKGSGHGASLNFGDCFAYALARHRNEPLLFVGNDFDRTDISSASDGRTASS